MALADVWNRVYGNVTFYRWFWTSLQVGAGALAGFAFDDVRIGIAVTVVTTIVSSLAREMLGAREAAKNSG